MFILPGADPGFWNGGWKYLKKIKNQISFQYLRDKKKKKKKKGTQKKRGGGGENSPMSPPLDPRLSPPPILELKWTGGISCIFWTVNFSRLFYTGFLELPDFSNKFSFPLEVRKIMTPLYPWNFTSILRAF